MFSTKLFLTIILLGIQLINPIYAAIYKCKSINGETLYSSTKCTNNAEIFSPKADHHPLQNAIIKPPDKSQVKPSVDIYIISWCPYCKKAMAYLHSKNIPFNAYDIEKDSQAKQKNKD